jgi:hypothetical protein
LINQQKEHIVADAVRETLTLIGSDKIEETAVYGADGNKIGFIERVMLEKFSGKARYAVLSFGGLLGIGASHYRLPWENLTYDTSVGGYRVNLTRDQLHRAARNSRRTWHSGDLSPATTLYNVSWAERANRFELGRTTANRKTRQGVSRAGLGSGRQLSLIAKRTPN